MTLTDPGHIAKIEGALDKCDDANEKICDVFTDPGPSHDDHLTLQRGLGALGQAKQLISSLLPLTTPPP